MSWQVWEWSPFFALINVSFSTKETICPVVKWLFCWPQFKCPILWGFTESLSVVSFYARWSTVFLSTFYVYFLSRYCSCYSSPCLTGFKDGFTPFFVSFALAWFCSTGLLQSGHCNSSISIYSETEKQQIASTNMHKYRQLHTLSFFSELYKQDTFEPRKITMSQVPKLHIIVILPHRVKLPRLGEVLETCYLQGYWKCYCTLTNVIDRLSSWF